MNELHELVDGDADAVVRALARIKRLGEDMALDGSARGFEIYRTARDALEILAFDRISRDALAKLSLGRPMFQGREVSEVVLGYMREDKKINAIKEFRGESGLGLKEAKDWVEAYMAQHGMSRPF
jgi:hypothetical protein